MARIYTSSTGDQVLSTNSFAIGPVTYARKIKTNKKVTLTGVFYHNKDSSSVNLRAVLYTVGGVKLAESNHVTVNANADILLPFITSVEIDPNTDYYIGVYVSSGTLNTTAENVTVNANVTRDGITFTFYLNTFSASGNAAPPGSTSSSSEMSIGIDYIPNNEPTLTLTSPANNLSLTEGKTYSIAGSATDPDNGNVVTIKYKINNRTARAINSGVSDGSTPIAFSKNLTYRNKRLWDGSTDVVGYDLAEGTNHTLYVWAEDDQGGKSADAVRNFTVLYNQPPQISGSDQDLGSISAPPSINYTVTDIEHYSFTITEKVGDTIIRSFAGTDGKQETLTIPDDIWIALQPDVTHNLTITATDQYGATSTRTYTFKRTVDGIELETRTPLPADAQPYRMVLTLNAQYPQNAVVNVQVCNNGYDENPTWEDATSEVLNKRPYVFTNTSKTAENWGIKMKISILPGV